uniref:non-specific serine/threonine protein kinase n=1 Tax=Fusarium oxysporum (strain Fo5176) TaxID=660025 RepID=A0A0D2YCW3_FUSOF
MALGSPGERRGNRQEERLKAMKNLKTWAEDFESTLRSIPENERSASSDYSPGHEPTTYKDVDRSPALPRKRTRRTAACQTGEGSLRKDDRQEPSDDESAPRPPDTPTPSGRNTRQGTRRSQRLALLALRPRGGGGGEQGRQYCTQKCLVGMVNGGFLDPKCPNVALHGKSCAPAARARHPVDHKEWLRLLWMQLKQSLDDGIRPLGEGGARGVLFQVTLLAHGYTFVSKGTVRAFIRDLEHEAAVYERLKPIQGVHVPVFLGAIDLRSMNKTYYYDHRVYVVHMTFLSWGGCSIDRAQRIGDMDRSLEDEAIRSLRAMHREGVIHKDVRLANMLFNPETNGVMVIDFERALLLNPPRRPLAQLVPNKRAWKSETMDGKKVGVEVGTAVTAFDISKVIAIAAPTDGREREQQGGLQQDTGVSTWGRYSTMESTTSGEPSSPLYQAEISVQFEDKDLDPEPFELSDDGLHFIQHSIKYAMSKLDKYRNLMERSVVYWAAMILHPGYGIGFLQLRLPNQVDSILRDFRDYFDRHYAQGNQAPVSPDSPPAFHGSKLLLRTANFPKKARKEAPDEINLYLQMVPEEDFKEEQLLQWWLGRKTQFPRLFNMAMDLLSISAMSSENERVFSAAKLTITSQRNALHWVTVEALQCLRNWARTGAISWAKPRGHQDTMLTLPTYPTVR